MLSTLRSTHPFQSLFTSSLNLVCFVLLAVTAFYNGLLTWRFCPGCTWSGRTKSSSSLCLVAISSWAVLLSYRLRKKSRFVWILPILSIIFLFNLTPLKILSLSLHLKIINKVVLFWVIVWGNERSSLWELHPFDILTETVFLFMIFLFSDYF